MEMNLIQEFANYMRNVKNRSELTITAYCSDIGQFCAVFHDKHSFNDITRKDIETVYITKLVDENVCAASRARKLSSLKAFYKWAKSNGYVVENPVESVESPKIPHKEPKVMSHDEVEEVLFQVRNNGNNECNLFRDTAILTLMFNTGLRRAEVVNIKLSDIDLEDSEILVHGKGNKERIVYFNDTTKAVLSEYIFSHRKFFKKAKESEYLFLTKQYDRMSVRTVNEIVNKQLVNAGIKDKGYTAHSTRKVFATTAYEATNDIVAISRMLGHANINTTQIYVGTSDTKKRKIAQAISF